MQKIRLENEDVFFTSDTHFGHNNIIRFCNRPFNDTKEMEFMLVENWNKVVSPSGRVFVLGDMLWSGGAKKMSNIVSRLNGKIEFIPGNHDEDRVYPFVDGINILSDIVHLEVVNGDDKHDFVLSHYPLATWQGRNRGTINLHGHIHSMPRGGTGYDKDLLLPQHYDVGVDYNNYKPVSISEIIANMSGMGTNINI